MAQDDETRFDVLRNLIFVETRSIDRTLPDYAYRNPMRLLLRDRSNLSELLLGAFEHLAEEHLFLRQERLFVQSERFEAWQELLSRMTPLPLLAYALYRGEYRQKLDDDRLVRLIRINLRKSTLPSIFSPFIDELLRTEDPSDLHIHLNGSTEVDLVWQEALAKPLVFYRNITRARHKQEVREHYLQIDDRFTEERLYELLCLARILRGLLVDAVFRDADISIQELIGLNQEYSSRFPYTERDDWVTTHPADVFMHGDPLEAHPWEKEAYLLVKIYHHLSRFPNAALATALHQYILILNSLNRILVHQVDQYGFDQFQRITLNEGREQSEHRYVYRFHQLEGMHDQDLAFLEGRFAPKKNAQESLRLLKRIVCDFEHYHGKPHSNLFSGSPIGADSTEGGLKKRMALRLVGHFIKKPAKLDHSFRHQALRSDLLGQARGIVALVDQVAKLREVITGFDAASNELHAPPEVFAPAFRYLRRKGFQNFTYHVGEDFVHLVSGIRSVYEAVEFLNLDVNNRIGHGTALGIDPKLWLDRSLNSICIERGEWLDNLTFAYHLLSESGADGVLLHRLHAWISDLYHEIYAPENAFDIHTLVSAWKMRCLDPRIAFTGELKQDCLDVNEWSEWEDIEQAERREPRAFRLFRLYHQNPNVRERYRELMIVDSDYFSPSDLIELQAKVINLLNQRCVAIEAMPSSNVRISFYQAYGEHHLFRWLNIKDDSPLPKPIVCLATDNPGIFATHLRNEMTHVYLALTNKFDQNPGDAAEVLRELHRNGVRFRFVKGLSSL